MAKEIKFSGYNWIVREDYGGPGPNNFSKDNVYIDKKGYLHLKITCVSGIWNCSEVYLEKSLGYGTYNFTVKKQPYMDTKAVLGLFTYENDEQEIDIEFSRWGCKLSPNFQFVVQPGHSKKFYGYSKNIISSFVWRANRVEFKSNLWPFKPKWCYKGSPRNIGKEKVHINLWLDGGNPAAKKEQEIIIKKFKFKKITRR